MGDRTAALGRARGAVGEANSWVTSVARGREPGATPTIAGMWRRLVLVGVVALAACSGAPAEDATGGDIYLQLCASCHARDLSGGVGPALGPGSGAVDLSDEVIAHTISRGKGSGMPAFSRTLSDAQIDRVVAFVREHQSG